MVKKTTTLHAFLLGVQHLLAMYSGAVAVPLLIGAALKFNQSQLTYLVSVDIFMCGVATCLQLWRNRYFGIGLPVMLGCAIQAVAPLESIGTKFSWATMYGAIIVAGIFVFVIAGQFAKLRRFFPPVVTGTLITVIGLSLIPVAISKIGGGTPTASSFGNLTDLGLAAVTLVIIIALQLFARGFLRSIAVLLGLVGGSVVAAFMHQIDFSNLQTATWFHLPQVAYFGVPQFQWSSCVIMIIIAIVSLIESTGVYFALGDLLGKDLTAADLKRGYRAEGLAVILGGVFNTFPYTTFSQNVGLLQLSGVKTKRPLWWAAGLLIVLGLVPKFGALATLIPDPVLGAAMLVMFALIAVQGIKLLSVVDLHDHNNMMIVAISLGAGLGVTVYPQIFAHFPTTAQLFLENGIVIATICAVGLHSLLSKQPRTVATEPASAVADSQPK